MTNEGSLLSVRRIYYRGKLNSCNYTCSYCPFGKKSHLADTTQDEQAWNAVCLPQENVHPHILYQVSLLSVQYRIFHRGLQLKRFSRFAHSQLFLKFSRPSKYRLFLFSTVLLFLQKGRIYHAEIFEQAYCHIRQVRENTVCQT